MKIHLINPMWNAAGSELRTYALYELLSPHAQVQVWSAHEPDRHWRTKLEIRKINPYSLSFPMGGTLVVVGVYFHVGRWVKYVRPRRTILIYNTPQPNMLRLALQRLSADGRRPVEIIYASEAIRDRDGAGLPGRVMPSLIDLAEFAWQAPKSNAQFVIGRLSRDEPYKHHEQDPAFYRRLTAEGFRVRVMGGTVLADALRGAPGIELLPVGAEPAPQFLHSLDCLFYRTAPSLFEAFGRVIVEAMAVGLPVVASRRGGYAEVIAHGKDGFLFDTDDEALAILRQLRADPALRLRIGQAARRKVEALFEEARTAALRYFIDGAQSEHRAGKPAPSTLPG